MVAAGSPIGKYAPGRMGGPGGIPGAEPNRVTPLRPTPRRCFTPPICFTRRTWWGSMIAGGVEVRMQIRSVLVVDDDERTLSACRRQLHRDGYQMHAATSSSVARRIVADAKPDLAIVDLNLGIESGIELVRELRRIHRR